MITTNSTIYDESIPITGSTVLFSLFTLLSGGVVIIVVKSVTFSKVYKLLRVPAVVVILLIIYFFKINTGFCTTENDLKTVLSKRAVTDHFIINYPISTDNNYEKTLVLLHEFYYEDLKNTLGFGIAGKIASFVFKNSFDEKLWFGAGNADVAKPWLNQIYIQSDSYGSTLKHELAHVFLSKKGKTIFKVADNFNPALIEGFAMALENDFDGHDIDEMSALAKREGFGIEIPELLYGLNFFGNFSSLSYIYAGSFIKYLFNTYGMEKSLKLYSNIDFEAIFDKSIEELAQEFEAHLDTLTINFTESAANLYFGRKPIFDKVCPRAAAHELLSAAKALRDSNYTSSAKQYKELFEYSGTFQSLRGWAVSEIRLENFQSIDMIVSDNADKFTNSAYQYSFYLLIADAKILSGDSVFADSVYTRIIDEYPNVDFLNAAQFRINLLNISANALKEYISMPGKFRFNYLIKLNSSGIIYESIPSMIAYSEESDSVLVDFFKEHADDFIVNSLISQNAAIKACEWLIEKFEYNLANKYISLADEFNSQYFSKSVFDKLTLTNWLIENKGMIEPGLFIKE